MGTLGREAGRGSGAGAWVLRVRNRYLLALDVVLLPLATYLAFVMRLDRFDLGEYWRAAALAMALGVALKLATFALLGGYGRYWPFASLPELELLVLTTALGVLATTAVDIVVSRLADYRPMPRSIPYIDFMLTLAALAGPRLGLRLVYNAGRRCETAAGRRVLIAGAGEAGNMVAQELARNPQLDLHAVGFVDDDPAKQGLAIRGVRVLGTIDEIPELAPALGVAQVLTAIPTASGLTMRRIVERCREAGVEVFTLPGIFELIAGDVRVQRFRPVRVEDLLARAPVETDVTAVRELLLGRRVLVTGGGGSIGSELCRQIAACGPASLTVMGHGENSVYHIHRELAAAWPELALTPVVADTRDRARLDHVLAQARPEVVVHAAAHKHVPLMELNPEEAVTNNVGGTRELVAACAQAGVGTFVMISTDKAVNPTSVMGATKRIAELLVQEAARITGRRYVAVRFGNVLGSRGSVVPLFQRQIEAGGPVTVTHPEIERYFMTIPEAVQLVLQAAAMGQGGEVFVLDMGEPVKIVDLARDMIRLAGLEEGHDIEIAFTGLRPGEKLTEELFLDDERYARTRHEKIFVSRNGHAPVVVGVEEAGMPGADGDAVDGGIEARGYRWGAPAASGRTTSPGREGAVAGGAYVATVVDRLLVAAQAHNRDEICRLIQVLVPEAGSHGQGPGVLGTFSQRQDVGQTADVDQRKALASALRLVRPPAEATPD